LKNTQAHLTVVRSSDGRPPPHDLDAEAVVLSACMLGDPRPLAAVRDLLDPDSFYSEAHRWMFKACLELADAGAVVDVVRVASWLKDRGRIAQVGGMGYITEVLNAAPSLSPRRVREYAKIVRAKCYVRRAIALFQRFAVEGYFDHGDHAAFLAQAHHAIGLVARAAMDHPVESNLEALKRIVRELQSRAASKDGSARGVTGIPTGLAGYDRLTKGLHGKQLTVIAARPGVGKSSIGLQVAVHAAERGIRVGFFSLEMSRDELLLRAVCMLGSVDSASVMAALLSASDWDRFVRAVTTVSNLPLVIDDTSTLDIHQLRARALHMIQEAYGTAAPVGLFVVDYLQYLPPTPELVNAPRRDQVGQVVRGLHSLAKETSVPVIALAQLNRDIDKRTGAVRKPRFSDLADSNEIEKNAHNVVFLHRDAKIIDDDEVFEEDSATELIVAKQRGGPRGSVLLTFEGPFTRFSMRGDQERPPWAPECS
jgi:replicative DNA helicase